MHDYDARIVDLYDGDNPAGDDHIYYRSFANRIGAHSILDIGCGTKLDRGQVLFRAHNRFFDTGEYLLQEELLTFPNHEIIADQLIRAGFEVSATWGGWHQSLFDGDDLMMVFESRAN